MTEFLSGLQYLFNSLIHICTLFGFLWQFNTLSNEDLSSVADQFCQRYSKHISREWFEELIFLKRIYSANFKLACKPHYLFQEMLELGFLSIFPNVCVALRIFLTLPVSLATAERSFSVLKKLKNFHRSTMSHERLNGLAMLNINSNLARRLDFSSIITTFAATNARKAFL